MAVKKPLVSVDGAAEKAPIVTKKKYKTTYDSITNPLSGDKECNYMEYISDQSFRLFPEKAQWRERLIHELYEWAFNDKSLEIMQFCMYKKVPYRTFMSWVYKHEDLANALQEAKLIIASRKRLGVIHKIYDKDMILRDLYRYDPEWIEVDKYNAELKKNESEGDKHLTVIMSPMPSVDSVKPKEER